MFESHENFIRLEMQVPVRIIIFQLISGKQKNAMNIPVEKDAPLPSIEENMAYATMEEYHTTFTTVHCVSTEASSSKDNQQVPVHVSHAVTEHGRQMSVPGPVSHGVIEKSRQNSDPGPDLYRKTEHTKQISRVEPELSAKIRANYANIKEYVEAFPLCDHLLQHGIITMKEHSDIRQKDRFSHDEANDELLNKLCKREFDSNILKEVLKETKQTVVLKLLF